MRKLKMGGVNNYIPPQVSLVCFVCEAGFSVSNDNLTEENWGWDE